MHKILFLHHSTGKSVWLGDTNHYLNKIGVRGGVEKYFEEYNRNNNTEYVITSQIFPKKEPYGWKNYPFDYYNIWVRNAGTEPYLEEPTLEILTSEYDVIIFKHCFPVGRIQPDSGHPDIGSEEKRLENYKLQYNALKKKMHSFPSTMFILWTPPALLESATTRDQAERTREFYDWITGSWKEKDDNIFLWDFYRYETEGGLYLLEKYAFGRNDSHPGRIFSGKVAPLFSQFIIDVIEENLNKKKTGRNGLEELYAENSDRHPEEVSR